MLGLIEPVGAMLIQQHLMIAVGIADRVEMILADGGGVVAGFGHRARLLQRVAGGHAGHPQHAVMPGR